MDNKIPTSDEARELLRRHPIFTDVPLPRNDSRANIELWNDGCPPRTEVERVAGPLPDCAAVERNGECLRVSLPEVDPCGKLTGQRISLSFPLPADV